MDTFVPLTARPRPNLPPELLLAVCDELLGPASPPGVGAGMGPHRSPAASAPAGAGPASVRPNSDLASLASVCRAWRALLRPALNESVRITNGAQLRRLTGALAVEGSGSELAGLVRAVEVDWRGVRGGRGGNGEAEADADGWPGAEVEALLRTLGKVGRVEKLALKGFGEVGNVLSAVEMSAAGSLRVLELDFAVADDSPFAPRPTRHFNHPDLHATLQLLLHCLNLPGIQSLHLAGCHLPPSLALALGGAPPSALRSLALTDCVVPSQVLVAIARHAPFLERLSLSWCEGFDADALGQTISLLGPSLRALALSSRARPARPYPVYRTPPSTPPVSPRRQIVVTPSTPGTPPSATVTAPAWPLPRTALQTVAAVVDLDHPAALDALPALPALEHLSLVGPAATLLLLAHLASACPALVTLSLAGCLAASGAALVDLLAPTANLPSLCRVTVLAATPAPHATPLPPSAASGAGVATALSPDTAQPDPSAFAELWGLAAGRGVELVGPAFEQVRQRVSWAEEVAKAVAEGPAREGGGDGEGRRRRRPGGR